MSTFNPSWGKPSLTENFVFVMNISSLEKEEFTIAPGHVLRRAKSEEIETIRSVMAKNTVGPPPGTSKVYWETELPPPGGGPYNALPPEKFRYFVLTFQGSKAEVSKIQQAADISIREAELGPTITDGGRSMNYNPGRLFNFLHSDPILGQFCKPFLESDAAELSSIYSQLKNHDKALVVEGIASEIAQLRQIDRKSHLVVLGYFAILEALLTHLPKPLDPYDSITRQIKKKVTLLDNRWTPRLNYSPFGGVAPEKVWEKMYSYRSALAHGTKPNFKSDLQLLRDPDQALSLVKETVKSIARFALVDPRLLEDLKDC
jgi:hypothetical protein